jgi:sugar/nucleoside kinase (ribokinase family)
LIGHLVADATARNIPVWLDPNYRKKLWPSPDHFKDALARLLPHVHTILPGLPEGQLLTGKSDPGEIACKLMGMGAKHVVLKAGPRAAAYWPGGSATADAPPLPRMIDPIGAGDAFDAGYLSATLDNLPPADALTRAHATAAFVCQTHGDWEGLPTRPQLETVLHRQSTADR